MGITHLPTIDDYWSKDDAIGSISLVCKTFSRNRYEEIDRNLHCVNNDDYKNITNENENYDCLYKIRPLYQILIESCKTKYNISDHISIDEGMIHYKGRNFMKQFIHGKPTKWGFKVWKLCDSSNGYVFNFDFYKGRYDKYKSGIDIVNKIIKFLPSNDTYHIYCDSFFTSIPLMNKLWKKNIFITGTLRKNSKYTPKEFKEERKNLKKNEICWTMSKPQFLLLAIYDSKIVTFISSCHSPTETCTKKKKQNNETKEIPKVMKDYNTYARGVDLNNQTLIYYSCNRKTRRWWLYLFWNMIDIGIVNSLILKNNDSNKKDKLSQRDFRIQLAKELIGNFSSRKDEKIKTKSMNFIINNNVHFPIQVIERKRCFFCNKKTYDKCNSCEIYICKKLCFETFHQ